MARWCQNGPRRHWAPAPVEIFYCPQNLKIPVFYQKKFPLFFGLFPVFFRNHCIGMQNLLCLGFGVWDPGPKNQRKICFSFPLFSRAGKSQIPQVDLRRISTGWDLRISSGFGQWALKYQERTNHSNIHEGWEIFYILYYVCIMAKLLNIYAFCWFSLLPINKFNKSLLSFFSIFCTGFPKKNTRFSKIKNIPDVLSDVKEGKIIEISIFNIWASFMGNPV